MSRFPLRIGVDEIATETQKCDGFTFFCLPERYAPDFSKDVASLLAKGHLPGFHGKKFKVAHTAAYTEFLTLAYEYIRKSPQAFAACRLFSEKVKTELLSFGKRLVARALKQSAVGENAVAFDTVSPYFLPLASLAALSRELAPRAVMRVELDECTLYKGLDGVVDHQAGVPIPAGTLLKGLYNGYAKGLHSRTPLLPEDGVRVLKDSKSALVQAADVIGNFALAYFFVALGSRSKSRVAKANVLRSVFGDEMPVVEPGDKIALLGNDLILKDNGSVTFKICWVPVAGTGNPELMKNWPKDDGLLGKGQVQP